MSESREGKNERMSPERGEEHQQRFLERKLKLAQRDDMGIVSRRTLESTNFIRLFGTTDFMLSLVRPNMGRKGKIDLTMFRLGSEAPELLKPHGCQHVVE